MDTRTALGLVLGACLLGVTACGDSEGPGDLEAAKKASAKAPKSADQLSPEMPAEAKSSATAAMGQAQAMQNQAGDPARVRAMQEMQKQRK
ncbi:MAG: hypothetical protein JSS65_03480 [Armatimonadetes bacterium]|nr:hypothetical protein [Armatimonadota bacterium]